MLQEGLLALLQRDRIDERLALDALQPRLDHGELRAVDHHRHASDIRLGRDEIEELDHGSLGIDQAFVHINVNDLRAIGDLVARDLERRREIAGRDQFAKPSRPSDIGALAHIDEAGVGAEGEGLKS